MQDARATHQLPTGPLLTADGTAVEVSSQLSQQLEEENRSLASDLEHRLGQVEEISQRMHEIAQLNSMFSREIQSQSQQIERLYDQASMGVC